MPEFITQLKKSKIIPLSMIKQINPNFKAEPQKPLTDIEIEIINEKSKIFIDNENKNKNK
jgi:hypothetical protein